MNRKIIAFLLVFVLLVFGSCSKTNNKSQDASTVSPWDKIEKNTYDATQFSTDNNGIMHYEGCDTTAGIDLSEFNTGIKWKELASLIDFCIIRCGYSSKDTGEIKADAAFDENMKNASANKLDLGVYFFSQAITPDEAVKEAEYVISKINKYDISYPVVFDMEYTDDNSRMANLSSREITDCIIAFCEIIKKAGYTPCVYGNQNWFLYFTEFPELQDYVIWLAEYNDTPGFIYDFDIWQYTAYTILFNDGKKYDLDLCLDLEKTNINNSKN